MKDNSLHRPDTDFPFSIGRPATGALTHAGYSKLKQLTKVTEAELAKLHGMGPKALDILRETLKEQGMSFAKISQAEAKKEAATAEVDKFMKKLKHPFKAEVEVLRDVIKKADKDITEEIKWNAPSFSYKGEYLVTFNLRDEKHIHLVFITQRSPKSKANCWKGSTKTGAWLILPV